MPILTWGDVDGNFSNTANWGGSTPSSNDTLRFLRGSRNILTGLAQGALTGLTIETGREWYGQIGSPGNPLVLGNTALLKIASPGSRQQCFSFTGATLTDARVQATNDAMHALTISAGTITALHVEDCGNIYLGPVTLTKMFFGATRPTAQCYIEPGAVVASIDQGGGLITSDADVDTLLRVHGGTFNFKGVNGGTMASILVAQNAKFLWNSPGSIITFADILGGILDGSLEDNAKTLTNANVMVGGVINVANGPRNYTISNNIKSYGGHVIGTNAVTYYMVPGGAQIGGGGVVIP